ncbi:MAG: hypothetical protein LBJ48_07160 [Coriobacteriales bacterium]|jgi:hypothetical protein|nr:hypothetical protein [Coriobacteriales bacterium]
MSTKIISAEEFDKIFDEGEEDILQYFDVSKTTRPGLEQEKISVSLPKQMLVSLDREAVRIGSPRQAVIELWLDEKLETLIA